MSHLKNTIDRRVTEELRAQGIEESIRRLHDMHIQLDDLRAQARYGDCVALESAIKELNSVVKRNLQ